MSASTEFAADHALKGRWDIAIVGGGSAGLPAAIFAARRGARVLLLDHGFVFEVACTDDTVLADVSNHILGTACIVLVLSVPRICMCTHKHVISFAFLPVFNNWFD